MLNLNGSVLTKEVAHVPLNNRAMNYGDALFETIRFSNNKLYFWEDHYFRLMASMRILRMEIPMNFTMEFLEQEILRTLGTEFSPTQSFRIKLLVWREANGKYCPETNDVNYAISTEPLDNSAFIHLKISYVIDLYKDHFISSGLLSTLKTNNRLINILGSIFAKENNFQNCLLLNERKQIVEALNGNIFLVFDKVIKTPPLSDGCLNGILRKQLKALLQSEPEYTLEEVSISPFELQNADEMFITNVIQGIVSVTNYRKKKYGCNVAEHLVSKLEDWAASH